MSNITNNNDRNNSRNKVKFILAWYNLEGKKLKDSQRLMLLNKWIKSCTQFEEYEMSNALLNEKRILMRQIRIKRIGKRSTAKKLKLLFKILIRKINGRLRPKI